MMNGCVVWRAAQSCFFFSFLFFVSFFLLLVFLIPLFFFFFFLVFVPMFFFLLVLMFFPCLPLYYFDPVIFMYNVVYDIFGGICRFVCNYLP